MRFWVKGSEWLDAGDDHAALVLADPGRFGVEAGTIDQVYAASGGKPGSEGPGRDALLKEVCKAGWTRIRVIGAGKDARVVCQAWGLDRCIPDIPAFLAEITARGIGSPGAELALVDLSGDDVRNFRISTGEGGDAEGDLESV